MAKYPIWKTVNEVREEMDELDPVAWREVNAEIKQKLKHNKKRIHPIEWVFIGVMVVICGIALIEIVRFLNDLMG